MKKFLLCIGFGLMATIGGAQVIVYVEAPSSNEGNYDHTYAESASGWGVLDLTDPVNSVQGTMIMADDGTADPNQACFTLTNGAAINGNIAVLYRGSCEFGVKAKFCQDQGAIGVIIINNIGGSPVGMGGGAEGPNVTIPVVMISDVDGALLQAEILAGSSTVFIGSKNGLYADDIGISQSEILRAEYFSNISLLSQDASEFDVQVGAWVRNYGQNDQFDVTLNVTIDLGASNLYDETSAPATILAGDSLWVPLTPFTQASYAVGYYDMTYTLGMGATDLSTYDNQQEANFVINDSLLSLSRLDPGTLEPIATNAQFHGSDLMESCIHFKDPNASRIGVYGINFSAGTSQNPTATSLDGTYIQVYFYEWLDVFTDINDYPDATWMTANLNILTEANFIYTNNAQVENIFLPFEENPVLVDDQRYLVCVEFENGVYPGYDNVYDYNENMNYYLQPINVVRTDGGQYFTAGFGTDRQPAFSLNFYDSDFANIAELSNEVLVGYPNPANEFIQIPVGDQTGNLVLSIVDITGKVVSTQEVSMDGPMVTVDVTTLSTGNYVFNLRYEDGSIATMNVVVTR